MYSGVFLNANPDTSCGAGCSRSRDDPEIPTILYMFIKRYCDQQTMIPLCGSFS